MVRDHKSLLMVINRGDRLWLHRVSRLCELCIRLLGAAQKEDNINPVLRVLEIFTTSDNFSASDEGHGVDYIFRYAAKHSYFESLRSLCDSRIPPLIEETVRPPTAMAGVILDMILRPLKYLLRSEVKLRTEMVERLTAAFFAAPFSEQVKFFVLPALAEMILMIGVLGLKKTA